MSSIIRDANDRCGLASKTMTPNGMLRASAHSMLLSFKKMISGAFKIASPVFLCIATLLASPLLAQEPDAPLRALPQDSVGAADQVSASAISKLQEEIRRIQRDTIDLQKSLINSGITPDLREDLDKLKKIEAMEASMKELSEQNAALQKTIAELGEESKKSGVAVKAESGWLGASWVWVLICGFLVMLMQAGFALVETGFTRAKNAAHTMMMNLLDYGLGMLVFWAFGFAIMFGGTDSLKSIALGYEIDHSIGFTVGETYYSILGNAGYFLAGESLYTGGVFTLFLFQMVFAATANTICTGTLAERWRIGSFCMTSIVVTGLIYPVFGHWVWGGGWLSALGYWDFAGSTVVHMTGGVIALVGAWIVGPRVDKFNADGSSNPIPGHNLPMAFLGTFLLAFGWFGFNAGSTLDGTAESIGIIATNTALASAAGMVLATLTAKLKFGVPDPSFACNGLLAGLVGITAPCAFVDAWAAVLVGAIAGILVVFSAVVIDEFLKLDDPVGAISVHGTCGAWGGIALGLFANGHNNGVSGMFYGNGYQLVIQALGVVVCFLFVGGASFLTFIAIDRIIGSRASDEQQREGLDLAEMGVEAYPKDYLAVK